MTSWLPRCGNASFFLNSPGLNVDHVNSPQYLYKSLPSCQGPFLLFVVQNSNWHGLIVHALSMEYLTMIKSLLRKRGPNSKHPNTQHFADGFSV